MAIHDIEQQALSAFLQASAACMEEPSKDASERCRALCELARQWDVIYVRELTRPTLRVAG
jgi:hypothetical protein